MADFNLDLTGDNQPKVDPVTKDVDITAIDGKVDKTDLDSEGVVTSPPKEDTKGDNKGDDKSSNEGEDKNNVDTSTGVFEEGTIIEIDGTEYSISSNGDMVDKQGVVYKTKDELPQFIKENNLEVSDNDDKSELSINSIKEKIGIDITDENGKSIEFTNDPEGVKSYIDKVIELKSNELKEAGINSIYSDKPVVKDFINYITVNGTHEGFGEIKDRSGVVVDKENVTQQEAIIRLSFQEFGKKGDVETYIKYLKESGSLYDVASSELEGIKEKDEEERLQLETKAKEIEKERIEDLKVYWSNVRNAIDSRTIAGYKIPDSTIIERDGKKITATPNDFFNYLSRTDKEGMSGYQRDIDSMTEEEVLNSELLDAWLHFTGGSYKDLVKLAINEETTRRLVLKAKDNKPTKTVVIKKAETKTKTSDILLS